MERTGIEPVTSGLQSTGAPPAELTPRIRMVEPNMALADLPIMLAPPFLGVDGFAWREVYFFTSFEILDGPETSTCMVNSCLYRFEPLRISELVLEQVSELGSCEAISRHTEELADLQRCGE